MGGRPTDREGATARTIGPTQTHETPIDEIAWGAVELPSRFTITLHPGATSPASAAPARALRLASAQPLSALGAGSWAVGTGAPVAVGRTPVRWSTLSIGDYARTPTGGLVLLGPIVIVLFPLVFLTRPFAPWLPPAALAIAATIVAGMWLVRPSSALVIRVSAERPPSQAVDPAVFAGDSGASLCVEAGIAEFRVRPWTRSEVSLIRFIPLSARSQELLRRRLAAA